MVEMAIGMSSWRNLVRLTNWDWMTQVGEGGDKENVEGVSQMLVCSVPSLMTDVTTVYRGDARQRLD